VHELVIINTDRIIARFNYEKMYMEVLNVSVWSITGSTGRLFCTQ